MNKLLALITRALEVAYPSYYNEAYDEGHADGVAEGYTQGWEAGEHHGYQEAQNSVAEWYTPPRY